MKISSARCLRSAGTPHAQRRGYAVSTYGATYKRFALFRCSRLAARKCPKKCLRHFFNSPKCLRHSENEIRENRFFAISEISQFFDFTISHRFTPFCTVFIILYRFLCNKCMSMLPAALGMRMRRLTAAKTAYWRLRRLKIRNSPI